MENIFVFQGMVTRVEFKTYGNEGKNLLSFKVLTSFDKDSHAIDCCIFGKYAEAVAPFMVAWNAETKEGSRVLVKGSLNKLSTNVSNDKTYVNLSCKVDNVEILNPTKKDGGNTAKKTEAKPTNSNDIEF
jgi:single-stranded DNA-binding protein